MAQYLEDKLQMTCKYWFDETYPNLALLLHHSPNEGALMDKRAAAKRKAMGVRAGFPDFILCIPKGRFCGLAIELKTEKGKQSDTQKEWQRAFESVGGHYSIIRSEGDFKTLITAYLNLGQRAQASTK